MDLPGYDDWKTHDRDAERCEYCGVHPTETPRGGWQPHCCTGQCGLIWKDPDAEYEKMRDEP